jgi:2,5-diamino-6-(ribosylamino)-4(3H)-pyrimidinone 5'-phosphate reductase
MNRPFVYINMAMTADGKITSATREYPRLTTHHDRTNMDRLRAEADAILVGARTLRDDSPNLHVRSPEMQEYRRSLGKSDGLLKVLVTASADLDPASRTFEDVDGGGMIVATVDEASEDRLARLAPAEIWKLGSRQVDLPRLLAKLHDERGVERLLVEGGGELNWAFARAGLVDEIFVTVAPWLLGGRDAPTLLEGDGFPMSGKRALRLIECRQQGDELYCRYAVEE